MKQYSFNVFSENLFNPLFESIRDNIVSTLPLTGTITGGTIGYQILKKYYKKIEKQYHELISNSKDLRKSESEYLHKVASYPRNMSTDSIMYYIWNDSNFPRYRTPLIQKLSDKFHYSMVFGSMAGGLTAGIAAFNHLRK